MTILKKLLLAAAVVVLIALAAVAIAGYLIPSERSFVNEISIDAPAETVWKVIADRERFTEWQTQLDRVEIVDDKTWIEYPKDAPQPLRFELVRDGRPTSLELGYTMGDSIRGSWRGESSVTPTGIKLKTIDSYRTDGLLMKLLMSAFFDLDSFAKDWNQKLKQRAESLK